MLPPPYLIPRVLKHMDHGQEYGTLVIPLWTSAPWWPFITKDGGHPESFVLNWMDIPQSANTFIPAKPGACIFSGRPNYHVLALKVSDLAREWQRVDSMGQRGPFIDTSLRGALLPSRGHDCVFGPHAVLLPVRDITCLKEAHGDCKKHHLPVRGTYGLLEAALACER